MKSKSKPIVNLRVQSLLKFVQPTFSLETFEKNREKLREEKKMRDMLAEKEKERRKSILEKMEMRNRELAGEVIEDKGLPNFAEDLDQLDNDEELASLGKRYRKENKDVAEPQNSGPKKLYTVQSKPADRDDNEEIGQEDGEDDAMVENANKMSNSKVTAGSQKASPLDLLSQKMLLKQKASGY